MFWLHATKTVHSHLRVFKLQATFHTGRNLKSANQTTTANKCHYSGATQCTARDAGNVWEARINCKTIKINMFALDFINTILGKLSAARRGAALHK